MSTDNTNYNDVEPFEEEAKRLAGLLDAHAQRLSMRTLKKLEEGRNNAVNRHQGTSVNADGTLSHWAAWVDHHRITFAGLILVAIVSSFILLQNLSINETSDAFLLGADLPPEAFVDLGFEPSLNRRATI
ncbi:MAG: hypothetical protein COB34_00040 [Methylophilaceae bacterium]|nr:MAG: hypothetical protein COB34_00040 [Methylophilaceae bacterium]